MRTPIVYACCCATLCVGAIGWIDFGLMLLGVSGAPFAWIMLDLGITTAVGTSIFGALQWAAYTRNSS